jgi:hypothetical protein
MPSGNNIPSMPGGAEAGAAANASDIKKLMIILD